MKNVILKIMVYIILIACSIPLVACGKTNKKIHINTNSNQNSQETLNPNINTNNAEFDSVEEQSKLLNEITELSNKLNNATDSNSINTILKGYYDINKNTTIGIYFAKENGEFYLIPNQQLPEGYDARKREWYVKAIENKVYISKYQDIISGKNIRTVSIVVSKDGKNTAVIGIDKFIE